MTPSVPFPLSRNRALGAAFGSGCLYFLAFPGVDLWPLGFVALVPLMLGLRDQAPGRALCVGWVAGLAMTGLGFYWVPELLKSFGGFGTPLSLLFSALLAAFHGGRMALVGWLTARGQARGWPFGLVFGLAFAASEVAYPVLFPWSFGAVVHNVPILMQLAELGGPSAVALVLVAANLAIFEVSCARLQRRSIRLVPLLALSAVVPLAALYGALRIRGVDAHVAAQPTGTVGIVQANMSLLGKREEVLEGKARHLQLTRRLVEQGPLDLVVWSETSVMDPVFEHEAESVIRTDLEGGLGVPTLFGAVLARRDEAEPGYVLFNSALLADAQGHLVGRYDKHHRLPFGEYLPFGDTFPVLYEWSPNSGRYAPGASKAPLSLNERALSTFICYEDVIPSFVNSLVREREPDLLVNLTNDAWFGDTTEPWIHLALAKFRAIEHRRFFVRSTNSGVSAIIDPVGRVVASTPTFEVATLRHSIRWLRGSTPFQFWGEAPFWLALALSGTFAVVNRRPHGRPKHSPDPVPDPHTSAM